MDEGLLNDLLECSVCLERLDTSSRVLPCQHTFCLKCLKVIVESHKELRCPECRILVEAKVEELPPNVLLMRILEGMKNSTPRRPVAAGHRKVGHGTIQLQQGAQTRADCKQLPPHARAMYDYISKETGDLSFKKGDTIILQKKLDTFWYQGECSGRIGMFPITYVQVVVPLPQPTALCKALYDFRMSAPDEEGCLAFDKGAIITVHRRVDENWAEGRLDQRVGIFPIAFVDLNHAARLLMHSCPINRPVPQPPDVVRTATQDHRHHTQHAHRLQYQQMSISAPASTTNKYAVAAMSQSQGTVDLAPGLQALRIADVYDRRIHKLDCNPHKIENYVRQDSIPLPVPTPNPAPTTQPTAKIETHRQEPFRDSSDSSSMNTPSLNSSNTSPNTSSDSSESAEPSSPSSPAVDERNSSNAVVANARNATSNSTRVNAAVGSSNEQLESDLNTSMGVLSLNESSTATNTSLNVTLPPSESPKISSALNREPTENRETRIVEEERLDVPSSSKNLRASGPDSLLNFGLGLQAALSPSHVKDSTYMAARGHREHHHNREKRHSLTPSTHLQGGQSTQNRHSAEILATSLLDQAPERDSARLERDRRRRRSRSSERSLPAAYVALYPYKPQKADELELKKGAVYTVTERCRDGWYKGCGERSARCGVFPGNYVAPAPASASASASASAAATACTFATVAADFAAARLKHDKQAPCSPIGGGRIQQNSTISAPDAPPRGHSPPAQSLNYQWSPMQAQPQHNTPRLEKSKEKSKAEKSSYSSGVSLMKRLAAMKKCKSPPPGGYSMDNPVFEDGPGTSLVLNLPAHHQPVHVSAASESPWQTQHRKSQSLDVTVARRDRHHSQAVKERFRCIVPYPPNSEYELELKVDDIVIVSRKRGDGWYKGTLQRTGRTGLFPASFVQSCPQD